MGKTLNLPIHWNMATAKPIIGASKEMGILVNGLRGSLKQSDFDGIQEDYQSLFLLLLIY